jgi:hypothetical protein
MVESTTDAVGSSSVEQALIVSAPTANAASE